MDSSEPISGKGIEELIRGFIAGSPQNSMKDDTGSPAWDDVLIGFASGDDPIWQQYKEYVGAFHWTPWEVYSQHCPNNPASPAEFTVLSCALPQRKAVRQSNRKSRKYPSEAWARIRVYGEAFNAGLRQYVAESLTALGSTAIAPMLVPNWTIVQSKRFSYASSWSERHAAHAAGLGTFGLCDGLITAKGKAMRVGSVVANVRLEPTLRPYSDHRAYCLYFHNGSCGKCIDRCPVRAITTAGHDKETCRRHLAAARKYVKKTYRFEGYGCGLCQVGVPCEAGIPVNSAREMLRKGELPPPPPPLA